MKILVLGHKGMLGHMAFKYLEQNSNHTCFVISPRFPDGNFKSIFKSLNFDYIVNCIGAIHQKTDDFKVNHELPVWLEENTKSKIIHPGTDCEMDDDPYGISKKKASDFILKKGSHTKIIKTSIIGPELNSNDSLLNWFLNSTGEVSGYSKAMWNGNTTLEWSKVCLDLINNWDDYKNETILSSPCISKYELLKKIKEVYKKNISIISSDKVDINKCLNGDISTPPIDLQLKELRSFYEDLEH
jgi:dTDP-4-dehydrorhamnose reductase